MILSILFLLAQAPPAETLALTLDQARELALKNHPALAALDYSARAAAEQPRQILAGLSPQVTASITGSVADDTTRFAFSGLNSPLLISRLGSGVQMTQLLHDAGRTRLLAAAATQRADAQKETIRSARLQVLLAVDRAYYNVLRARALTRVVQQTVEARQLVVDQLAALTESQLRSTIDLAFAKANLVDAQIQLNRANNERDAADADLAVALGLSASTRFDLADRPVNDILPPESEPLVARALAERPELRQLALELEAANRQLAADKLLAKPTLSFQGTAGVLPLVRGNFPHRFAAAGLTLSIPILNGKLFASRQAESALRARAIEKQREDRNNQIARDVRTAFLNARNAFDRLRLTSQLLDQAKLSLDLAQARYDLGLGNIVELSQAQLNFTAADVATANARFEYQTLRSVLRYQLGEGPI
jgi:outer membrane protein